MTLPGIKSTFMVLLIMNIGHLLEAGFEPVTVSELFGFDPPETGGEIYVYDRKNFTYPRPDP